MHNLLHHPMKAGFDIANITSAVSAVTLSPNFMTYCLAIPSFIYSSVLLIEWIVSKFK